jgi:lactam utilization protein B
VIAQAVLRGAIAALGSNVAVIGPPSGSLREVAATLGMRYAREGFADRRMREDSTLVPRNSRTRS